MASPAMLWSSGLLRTLKGGPKSTPSADANPTRRRRATFSTSASSAVAPCSQRLNGCDSAIDLLNSSTGQLAKEFKDRGISADYIFHFAYTDTSVTSSDAGNSL